MAEKKNKCTRCGADFLSINKIDRRWKRRKKDRHTQKDNTSTCIRCFVVQGLKNKYETEKASNSNGAKSNTSKRQLDPKEDGTPTRVSSEVQSLCVADHTVHFSVICR
jgi:hypothetical protein